MGPNTTTIIQSKVGPNTTTIIQFDAGQNPTLNYMRRILTRTMDMLLESCIAGQNPTRVKILRNSSLVLPLAELDISTQFSSFFNDIVNAKPISTCKSGKTIEIKGWNEEYKQKEETE